jgi:hypothetical protein
LLNWRETSSDPIITELTHARIHTTREAKARKEFVTSLARPKRRRLADDVGENLFTAVGFVFD